MLSHNIRSNQYSLPNLKENMSPSPANQSNHHWNNGFESRKPNNGCILPWSTISTQVKPHFQNVKTNSTGQAWVNGKFLQIINMFHVII